MMQLIRLWCRLACTHSVVIRGLKYAAVVGAVLVSINHGDAILRGDWSAGRLIKIVLTILVPYCVSVLSSVGAMRQLTTAPSVQQAASPSPRQPHEASTPRSL